MTSEIDWARAMGARGSRKEEIEKSKREKDRTKKMAEWLFFLSDKGRFIGSILAIYREVCDVELCIGSVKPLPP